MILFIGVSLIAAAIIWAGLRKVPVGYRGIVLNFGRRSEEFLDEGWHWVLPIAFIKDLAIVDVKEKTVPQFSEDTWTSDRVRLRFNATVQYRVADLKKFLSLEENVVEGDQKGIIPLFQQVIREQINQHPLEECLVGAAVSREEGIASLLKSRLASNTRNRWGIEILDLFISDLDVDDRAMQRALQAKAEKELIGQAETVQLRYDLAKVKTFGEFAEEWRGLLSERLKQEVSFSEALEWLEKKYANIRELDIREMIAQSDKLIAAFLQERSGVRL